MQHPAKIEIDPKTFLHDHCSLPALPSLVLQIQEIVYQENVNIGTVADLIAKDPALVAQVLKIVNSAYYSFPREIAKVKLAVAYLGIHEVFRIVLSMSVINSLSTENKDDFNDIWKHSFYAALCSRYLAKRYDPLLPHGELWTAAILHDIGKLVYLKFFPRHYEVIHDYVKKEGCFFSDGEEHFGYPSSAFLGSLLCDRWRLPNQVRDACEFHTLDALKRNKDNQSSEAFRRMICMGNLTSILAKQDLRKEKKEEIADLMKETLDITDAEFLNIMGDIYELEAEVEKFII